MVGSSVCWWAQDQHSQNWLQPSNYGFGCWSTSQNWRNDVQWTSETTWIAPVSWAGEWQNILLIYASVLLRENLSLFWLLPIFVISEYWAQNSLFLKKEHFSVAAFYNCLWPRFLKRTLWISVRKWKDWMWKIMCSSRKRWTCFARHGMPRDLPFVVSHLILQPSALIQVVLSKLNKLVISVIFFDSSHLYRQILLGIVLPKNGGISISANFKVNVAMPFRTCRWLFYDIFLPFWFGNNLEGGRRGELIILRLRETVSFCQPTVQGNS